MNSLPHDQHTQAPAGGANPVGTLQLNYWLSAFFMWLPALIFWLLEKDKGDQRATALHVENLNFSLVRTAIVIVSGLLGSVPYVGWVIVVIGWLVGIVFFVFHVIAAAKIANLYSAGAASRPFIFNIPLVK